MALSRSNTLCFITSHTFGLFEKYSNIILEFFTKKYSPSLIKKSLAQSVYDKNEDEKSNEPIYKEYEVIRKIMVFYTAEVVKIKEKFNASKLS